MKRPCELPVVCLSGPTASGKTALALALAVELDAEIVSVDSALVYRGMDIGTAKPDARERAMVPHHLIDILEPAQAYSAARFVDDALQAISAIRSRGHRPLLVGGTVLYFKALLEGLAPLPAADPAIRQALLDEASQVGWPSLHARLASVDAASAARLHPNDAQRVQRALEVHALTGRALSDWHRETRPAFAEPVVQLALVPEDRAWLHQRIGVRLQQMRDAGFDEEVRALHAQRLDPTLPALRSVGYRQALEALARGSLEHEPDGSAPLWPSRAIAATRQLAKRQLTWLRAARSLVPIACDTLSLDEQRDRALAALNPYRP